MISKLFIVNFIILLLLSCSSKTDIVVEDVHLESIEQVEEDEPLPPPPPLPSGVNSIQSWLTHICRNEKPGKAIIAYHFGLFETPEGFSVSLTGSEEYNNKNDDWTLNEDFIPSIKYYPLSEPEYITLDWKGTLASVKKDIARFQTTNAFKNSFFAKAEAITIGFDEGELERIK